MNLKINRLGLMMAPMFFFLLFGCGEKARIQSMLEKDRTKTQTAITNLENKINRQSLRNIVVLDEYATLLVKAKPEFKAIARTMKNEGTTDGNLFRNLLERFNSDELSLYNTSAVENGWKAMVSEYQLIREAAGTEMFNDALTDPINVLADLSNGKLARVQSVDRKTSQLANGARNFGAGSQLMGNPNYGYWRNSGNGTSFWEWYGMYALFSNLSGGSRYYYHDWGRYRDYSYYSDYGRHHYTSSANRVQQDRLEQRTRKSFGQRGKPFKSPYAKQRVGSSGVSRVSKSNASSAKRSPFNSSFSKKSTSGSTSSFGAGSKKSSSSSGSFRNSNQRVSRGLSFGK